MTSEDPLLRPIEIAPSILASDFANLGSECAKLQSAGADRLHWDVMDGVFVPNLTIGPDVIAACRPHSDLPFEAHLMVVEPDRMVSRYIDAGCSTVMVHAETCPHLHRSLSLIRDLGAKAGVVLNPHTPAAMIRHVLEVTDHVLVMSVNPGFGGQSYISAVEPKIAEIRTMIDAGGHQIDIEIDGGISSTTIESAARSGANIFVSGSAVFGHPDGTAAAMTQLKQLAQAVR